MKSESQENNTFLSDKRLCDRQHDQWLQMGTGKMCIPDRRKSINVDVAVMGGGMAGICAAVAAARNGVKVALVQDRSVLGGNASSEIRVIVHGVTKLTNGFADRETGIIEEILLHNRFYNPQNSFPVWDHMLYEFVMREPNIQLLLDTQALCANVEDHVIKSALCWQGCTEMVYEINAEQFIDCSGDGLLAASAGAHYRTGREAKAEFNEQFAPEKADGWHLGPTILLSSDDMGKPMPFEAPSFAIPYDADKSHPDRKIIPFQEGFWWVEVGSDFDIVGDFDAIRHKLMGYAYGVWDYVKNSGKFPETENYALNWVGSVPGRRESRRFMGDHILSESDLLEHKHFNDAVAFGGWPLDEHNPGGIENLKDPPSFWHSYFDTVYEIPYGSLYSKNITNLHFAGRNISVTHVALSSTRVMATCATMGQAVGTAASLCVMHGVKPRELREHHIEELQEQLLRDDAYIPNRPADDPRDLVKKSKCIQASSTQSGDVALLVDGVPRDEHGNIHHWSSVSLPAEVELTWDHPIEISRVHIKCDTNLQRNIMMLKFPRDDKNYRSGIPEEMIKSLEVQALVGGEWVTVVHKDKNKTRLIQLTFNKVKTAQIKVRILETYGSPRAKLFEIRCYEP